MSYTKAAYHDILTAPVNEGDGIQPETEPTTLGLRYDGEYHVYPFRTDDEGDVIDFNGRCIAETFGDGKTAARAFNVLARHESDDDEFVLIECPTCANKETIRVKRHAPDWVRLQTIKTELLKRDWFPQSVDDLEYEDGMVFCTVICDRDARED